MRPVPDGFTIAVAGDMLGPGRPVSANPLMAPIVKIIGGADVAFANLEGLTFDMAGFTGYGAAVSGAGPGLANGGGAPVLTETDGNGFFSFRPVRVCPCWSSPSIPAGTTLLFIEKNGYDDPPGLPESAFRPHGPGFRDVMIDGDTRVRIQLVRR